MPETKRTGMTNNISVLLNSKLASALEKLTETSGLTTKSDFLRFCISTMQVIYTLLSQGAEIVVKHKDGYESKLQFPRK